MSQQCVTNMPYIFIVYTILEAGRRGARHVCHCVCVLKDAVAPYAGQTILSLSVVQYRTASSSNARRRLFTFESVVVPEPQKSLNLKRHQQHRPVHTTKTITPTTEHTTHALLSRFRYASQLPAKQSQITHSSHPSTLEVSVGETLIATTTRRMPKHSPKPKAAQNSPHPHLRTIVAPAASRTLASPPRATATPSCSSSSSSSSPSPPVPPRVAPPTRTNVAGGAGR